MHWSSIQRRSRTHVLLGFAALTLLTISGCESTTAANLSSTENSALDPLRIIPEENRLEFTLLNPGETVSVDVSDLQVDFDCVDNSVFSAENTPASMRIILIRSGCATLLPDKGTADEQAAQAEVRPEPVPGAVETPTAESPSSSSGEESGLNRLFTTLTAWVSGIVNFIVGNYQWIIGILVTIFLGATYQQWHKTKHVRVILAGAPSAGKTDFWTALSKDSQPNSGGEATVGSKSELLAPLEMGKKILYPIAVDAAGGQPERVLDEIRSPRTIRRWRQKLMLVIVVSPLPEDTPLSADPYDELFIQQQIGYLSFPRALVRTKHASKRPHAVILFVSKFDLLSPNPPADTAAEQLNRELRSRFSEHRHLIEGACTEVNVPFEFIVGSAKRGWGVDEARKALWKSVR
jgi:hypothetical protein